MANAVLSEATFENLIEHLKEIERKKNELFERFFPEPSNKREEFKNLLNNYIKYIDQFVRNAKNSQDENVKVPFATIGSEVEVQEPSNNKIFKYRIVSPLNTSAADGDVSYLSPVGKSLLLKKVGDEIKVNAPGGVYSYKIKSIKTPAETVPFL